nr:unnamed protein product [Digitaria exilis]
MFRRDKHSAAKKQDLGPQRHEATVLDWTAIPAHTVIFLLIFSANASTLLQPPWSPPPSRSLPEMHEPDEDGQTQRTCHLCRRWGWRRRG